MIRNFYRSEKFSSHGYFTLSLLGQNVCTSCKKLRKPILSSRKNQEHRKIASLSLQLRSYNKSLPTTRNKIVRIFYKFSARAPKKGHAGVVTVDRSLPPPPVKKTRIFTTTRLYGTSSCYKWLLPGIENNMHRNLWNFWGFLCRMKNLTNLRNDEPYAVSNLALHRTGLHGDVHWN